MIGGIAWPDLVIAAVIALTTFKGFTRGFISELGGALAMLAGLIAPRYYNGSADGLIDHFVKLGLPIAHGIGVLLSGVLAYAIVLAIAALLNRVAKLPILGLGNAIAGAVVGFLKGAVLLWLILFLALFFPLTPPLRDALHGSYLARELTAPNGTIDSAIEFGIPPFVRPWVDPFFARHHV
jgi:uncharacterized membrane protein required for colicin V production